MTIETVLLDAGGVILDETEHEQSIATGAARFLRAFDPAYSERRYRQDAARAVERFSPRVYLDVFWQVLKPDVDRCREAHERFFEEWRRTRPALRLMEGIAPELRRLAGRFRVGLAGQYGREIVDLLEAEGLMDCFAWRHTQDDFDVTKPDPRFYERIAAAFGVDPRACVMVGDRIDKDVIPARLVGMRTVRIRLGLHREQEPRSPDEVPDAELPSVVGLAKAIEAMAAQEGEDG